MDATDSAMIRYASQKFNRDMSEDVVDTWMKPHQLADLMLKAHKEGPDGRTENDGDLVKPSDRAPSTTGNSAVSSSIGKYESWRFTIINIF